MIATVVLAALFVPQAIFWVQDDLLCRKTSLGQRESMGAEALSTVYEKSLAARMRNFAEGLAAGERFYVTSQSLTVNAELEKYLKSDRMLYLNLAAKLAGADWMADHILAGLLTVAEWKQYVIYSDNYDKGVNFILWYIDLKNDVDGVGIRILADAEDGTIYALRTENAYWLSQGDTLANAVGGETDRAAALWAALALHYGALEGEAIVAWMEKKGWITEAFLDLNLFYEKQIGLDVVGEMDAEGVELLQGILEKAEYRWETPNCLDFILPYGGAALDCLLGEMEPLSKDPKVIIGIRQIYECIPDFLSP